MRTFSVLLLVVLSLAAVPALLAQGGEAIASGLVNPRGIAYDAEGNLYVVEAGNGGDIEAQGPFGPTPSGATGQVTRVQADGGQEVIIRGLPSMNRGDARGAQAIYVTDEALWLLIGEGPLSFPFSHALVALDRETLRVTQYVDLYTLEATENPGGDIVESNPTDFVVAADGTIYIADASANAIWSWTAEAGVQLFAVWSMDDNPVPTTVALGPEGDLYVSFLTGFPFPQGTSRIERWTTTGELVQTYEGLTAVVDLLVDDMGTIYAVEFGVFGDQGWGPGRVVRVSAEGVTPVMEGLDQPWGLAQDAGGNLVVSGGASGGDPARGMVIPVESGM